MNFTFVHKYFSSLLIVLENKIFITEWDSVISNKLLFPWLFSSCETSGFECPGLENIFLLKFVSCILFGIHGRGAVVIFRLWMDIPNLHPGKLGPSEWVSKAITLHFLDYHSCFLVFANLDNLRNWHFFSVLFLWLLIE